MAVFAILSKEQVEKLPEQLREHYTEVKEGDLAGRYVLDVTQTEIDGVGADKRKVVYSLEDIYGLKNTLQSLRDQNKELARKSKDYEGLDPAEARNALNKLKELGDNATKADEHKAALDNLKQQLEQKYQSEVQKEKEVSDALDRQLRKILVDQRTSEMLDKFELIDSGKRLLEPHIKSQLRIHKDDGGEYEVRVVDPKTGQDRVSLRAGENGYMGIDELVDTMSKDNDFKVLFAAPQASGAANSGSKPQQSPDSGKAQQQSPDSQSANRGIQSQFKNPVSRLQEVRSRQQQPAG